MELHLKRITLAIVLLVAWLASAQVLVAPTTAECATSVDGSAVGVPNPLNPPILSTVFSGTLPAGNYFVQETWYDASANTTLVGPEVQIQLSGTGEVQENPPSSGMSANAVGRKIYIGITSGGETLQGSVVGSATFTQSIPLVVGAAVPASNNTVCNIIANDAGWPTGTGYVVTLTTPAGNTVPGYPMQWQLLGPGNTINLGNGLPLYNGTVTYPIPILARPYGHGPQSISGPLSLGGFTLTAGTVDALHAVLGNPAGDASLTINGASGSVCSNELLTSVVSNGRSGEFQFQMLCPSPDPAAAWEFINIANSSAIPLRINVNAPSLSLDLSGTGKLIANSGIGPGKGWQHGNNMAPCTTAASSFASCNSNVNWSPSMASTTYDAVCTGVGITSGHPYLVIAGKGLANITVETQSLDGSASAFSEIDCEALNN